MIAKITIDGSLLIKRGKVFKEQVCPYNPSPKYFCGDWCPRFGEPENFGANDMRIKLCDGESLRLESFEDERG